MSFALVLHLLSADNILVDLPDLRKESIPETEYRVQLFEHLAYIAKETKEVYGR